jgi:hypothetical protein
MSKSTTIDFSDYSDDIYNNSFWAPSSKDYFGSHGYSESRYAIANFLSIGDVGDPEWREARRLPFGDEALEALYPGSRGISFIQYPWEHPDADTSVENPVSRLIDNDLAFDWALKEMQNLDSNSERYQKLSAFIAEIRNYNNIQIEEEAFIHAPSWAMDALIHAQENAYDSETTKIVEEFGARGANSGKVISTTMYPSYDDVKRIADVHDEYKINMPGFKQHCFALKNGKKVFGPYGSSYAAFTLFKDPNRDISGSSSYRREQMFKALNDSGIVPVFDQDNNLSHINHISVTPDNLIQAKANYSNLANIINEANTTMSMIMGHVRNLQEDIYWDKLKLYLKKLKIYDDVMSWSADLSTENKRFSSLQTIGHEGLDILIDDYSTIKSKIYSRINNNYYVLNVGKNTQIGITDSLELANYFKDGDADDLLYFLMPPNGQKKLETLSQVKETYGYNSKQHKDWVSKSLKIILSSGKYKKDTIQDLICQYNTSRRAKTIYSRTMREYGWLLGDLPFTRAEITTMNDCLEAYGRAIVAAQQQVPIIKQVFARLKSKVEKDILDNTLPAATIERIAKSGLVNFVYSVKIKPIPVGQQSTELVNANLISKQELMEGSYLDITLHYDYVFHNPSDVFRYINNFAVGSKTVSIARSLL